MSDFKIVVIEDATLIMADCRDWLDTLPECFRVHALVTDPPYGVDFKGKSSKGRDPDGGYNLGDTDIGPQVIERALKHVDRGVVFPGNRLLFDYPRPYEFGVVYCPAGVGNGRWGFTNQHPMLFYGQGLPHARQSPSGFESFDSPEICDHPCPKPTRWMMWAVAKCTLEAQTVIDPFMGSGTTGVACANLGRKFIGIELDPAYFEIACRRIAEAYRQPRLFIEHQKPEQMVMFK